MNTFRSMLDWEELKGMEIVAGKNAVDEPVSWIHMVFGSSIKPWMNKGDILVVSENGLIDVEKDLVSIIEQISEIGVVGLIIEMGTEKKFTFAKIISKADELGVVVAVVHNKIDMVLLSKHVSQQCFKDELVKDRTEILRELVYLPYDKKMDEKLESGRFVQSETYVVFAIKVAKKNHIVEKKGEDYFNTHFKNRLMLIISTEFLINERNVYFFEENGVYIYLIAVPKERTARKELLLHSNNICMNALHIEERMIKDINIGIGNVVKDIKSIRTSVYQAKYALFSLEMCKRHNTIRLFEDMGVYRILYQYHNDRELAVIYDKILGKLQRYDEENNSQLMDTLEMYFNCNCNLSETADELFIHKNTLKYRMKKIKDILQMDYGNVNSAFTLELAFKIRKYLWSKGMLH